MSHRIWFALICGLALMRIAPCAAADEPAHQDGADPQVAAEATEKPARPKPTPRQRQILLVGVYLLAAVACVGAVLLIWIVWWGARLRAFNRRPLPAVRTQDPFWFLKQPVEQPPPPPEGNPPAGNAESADPP